MNNNKERMTKQKEYQKRVGLDMTLRIILMHKGFFNSLLKFFKINNYYLN
jgi:hypothetical protein